MSKPLMIIYDLDAAYGESLLSRLSQKENFPYEVKLVTNLKGLEESEEEVELLLLAEELEGVRLRDKIHNVIYLTEGFQNDNHVNRYQSIDKIAMRIMEKYQAKGVERSQNDVSTEVIVVYSPLGGCGKTKFAKETAMFLGRQGRQVYFFDFDLLPNTIAGKNADFFYDLRERALFKHGNWNEYFTFSDGVYFLLSTLYCNELWNLSEEDYIYLIEGIKEKEECACYIFDIGFINNAVIKLLAECTRWILPCKGGLMEQPKIKNLREMLLFRKEDALERKMEHADLSLEWDVMIKKLMYG